MLTRLCLEINSGGQAHKNKSIIATLAVEHAGEILLRSTSPRQLMREALGRNQNRKQLCVSYSAL